MNVNTYFYNNYSQTYRLNKQPHKQTSFAGFGGIIKSSGTVNKRKIFSILLAAAMLLLGLTKCKTSQSDAENNINGVNVEYFNVKPETKETIIQCCEEFTSKLNDNNNFLKGTNLIITDEPSSLNDNSFFKKYFKENYTANSVSGLSFYSDGKLPRSILIEESTHLNDLPYYYKLTGENSVTPLIRFSLTHEMGHHFSEYFGHNHNDKFALELDSLLKAKDLDPNENPCEYRFNSEAEYEIAQTYLQNNELADKEDFKNAILKDYKHIAEMLEVDSENLPLNIYYYTYGIDFWGEITLEDVEYADMARSEVYANLFAYAVGENNGDKTKFINAFSNSFEVVKNDVKTYLGEEFVK